MRSEGRVETKVIEKTVEFLEQSTDVLLSTRLDHAATNSHKSSEKRNSVRTERPQCRTRPRRIPVPTAQFHASSSIPCPFNLPSESIRKTKGTNARQRSFFQQSSFDRSILGQNDQTAGMIQARRIIDTFTFFPCIILEKVYVGPKVAV